MPVITLNSAKLSKEQKGELIKELTAVAAKIMNIPEQSYYVFLKENETDNVGVGGQLLAEYLKDKV
ncbi:4-oxalocrotonate tautomerase [Paenibacillus sp. 1_12]|uniref:4-oxalocrotonate tautomerase DmpI n=1 Tax=Paenibacillus sp. 1_12 TaxID=1566278 RepID=UPI0008ED7236|nr:4-oxalocrotonate tautomerase DmpI [Paenibacillus sp. 1_12]SFM10369.1 4-oxalocrotonate tautomerase [Paenibacillus sp. 1_12]